MNKKSSHKIHHGIRRYQRQQKKGKNTLIIKIFKKNMKKKNRTLMGSFKIFRGGHLPGEPT